MSTTVVNSASRSIRLFLDLRGSTFALCAGANILGYTPLKNNGTAGKSPGTTRANSAAALKRCSWRITRHSEKAEAERPERD
jgi:hypothetical protein